MRLSQPVVWPCARSRADLHALERRQQATWATGEEGGGGEGGGGRNKREWRPLVGGSTVSGRAPHAPPPLPLNAPSGLSIFSPQPTAATTHCGAAALAVGCMAEPPCRRRAPAAQSHWPRAVTRSGVVRGGRPRRQGTAGSPAFCAHHAPHTSFNRTRVSATCDRSRASAGRRLPSLPAPSAPRRAPSAAPAPHLRTSRAAVPRAAAAAPSVAV
jgi:hypothetical protein